MSSQSLRIGPVGSVDIPGPPWMTGPVARPFMQLRQSRNIGNSSKRRASDLARSTSTASRSSTGSSCDAVLRGQGAVEVTTLKELQEETLERNRILESTTEFTPESFEEVRK